MIMDVEATTLVRQAEVGAAKTMLDRTAEQFDLAPSRLVADAGYGSAEMIEWLVDERGIEPHVKPMDKSERKDGTFSRSDFAFDPDRNLYVRPSGKELRKYHRAFFKPRDGLTKEGTLIYFASKLACEACALKPQCCPNTPARKIARSIHEAARDKARAIAKTEAYVITPRTKGRDALRSFEAHPQARPIAPAWPKGSEGRVPVGRHRPKSEETGEAHPPSDAGLRHIRRRGPGFASPATTRAHIAIFRAPGSSTVSPRTRRSWQPARLIRHQLTTLR